MTHCVIFMELDYRVYFGIRSFEKGNILGKSIHNVYTGGQEPTLEGILKFLVSDSMEFTEDQLAAVRTVAENLLRKAQKEYVYGLAEAGRFDMVAALPSDWEIPDKVREYMQENGTGRRSNVIVVEL